MKTAKKILKVLGWVLLGLVVIILLLPLWIGPVACGVANSVTPDITKTDFYLGHFRLNPYSGHVEVGDMQLANPTNFSEKNAVDLGLVTVDLSVLSLATDVIHVKDITVDGLKVYLDAPDVANFKQIAENASGDKKEPESAAVEETAAVEKPAVAEESASVEEAEASTNETRVVIDCIALKNITIQYGMLPIPIPDFEIHDIGRDAETGEANGATWQEAWLHILEQISSQAEGLGKGLFKFGKNGALAISDAATTAASAGLSSLSGATDEVGDAAGKAEKALEKGMGKAMKEADKAVKFINGFFGSGDKKK